LDSGLTKLGVMPGGGCITPVVKSDESIVKAWTRL
jgi:hypothetical protein